LTAYLLIFGVWCLVLLPLWIVALFSAKSYHLLSSCEFFAGIFSGMFAFMVYLDSIVKKLPQSYYHQIIFLLPLDDNDFGAEFFQ